MSGWNDDLHLWSPRTRGRPALRQSPPTSSRTESAWIAASRGSRDDWRRYVQETTQRQSGISTLGSVEPRDEP